MKPNLSRPKKGVNSAQQAANFIREGIREGRFAPGQRLIARDVAGLTGGGVGSFREALLLLAGEGLVTLQPNRGAAVRGLSKSSVRQIFLLREAVDPLAARLSAQLRHSGEESGAVRLQRGAQTLERAFRSGRVSEFHAARQELFALIWETCGADRIRELAERLGLQVSKRENESQLAKESLAASHRELQAVVDYILAGEPSKAERAMRAHIRRIGKAVLAGMPESRRTG